MFFILTVRFDFDLRHDYSRSDSKLTTPDGFFFK